MKLILPIAMLCAMTAYAQRGGVGGARPGMGGGARGILNSPGPGRGVGGGMGRGFGRPGIPQAPSVGGRFRGTTSYFGIGWPGWGWGLGSGNYGCPYSYPCSSYVTTPYVGGYWPGYSDVYPIQSTYYSQPAVTVVYPQQPVALERAHPVTRVYDDSGRETQPQPSGNASPIYLFALEDQTIRAASAYRIEGATLHYVTLQHKEKRAPLDTLDRALTLQLNRERGVIVKLP